MSTSSMRCIGLYIETIIACYIKNVSNNNISENFRSRERRSGTPTIDEPLGSSNSFPPTTFGTSAITTVGPIQVIIIEIIVKENDNLLRFIIGSSVSSSW